ncbi:unnamed protein product [Rotaria sordida]|uniref:Uncharacterized protein n=1 Tax=Rotaria sordida TaxID=392033 RepID=A0A815Q1B7_9BILA|nr:unnamed protein product [Rotaria sordida]
MVRFVVAQLYNGIIGNNEKDYITVFLLTVITDILIYIIIRHKHTLIDKKDLFCHVFFFNSTSFISFIALSRSLSHAWITFLLVTMKVFYLYQMDFFMIIVAAFGMLVSFHDQTLLFIIMCWPLFIQRWILFSKNEKHEEQRKKLINCNMLIILSIYAYIHSKPIIITTWILPPWMLYYDLLFTLYVLNLPIKLTEFLFEIIFMSLSILFSFQRDL